MNVQKLNQQQHLDTAITECGNCWGHQEWNGQVCDKPQKRTTTSDDGFILKFVKKYLV